MKRDVRKCYTSALICRGEQQDLGTALENLKVLMNDGDNDFEKCYLAFKIASKTRDLSIDLKSCRYFVFVCYFLSPLEVIYASTFIIFSVYGNYVVNADSTRE